jgi:hypothetical protein
VCTIRDPHASFHRPNFRELQTTEPPRTLQRVEKLLRALFAPCSRAEGSTATHGYYVLVAEGEGLDAQRCWTGAMQLFVYELPRIPFPGDSVNSGNRTPERAKFSAICPLSTPRSRGSYFLYSPVERGKKLSQNSFILKHVQGNRRSSGNTIGRDVNTRDVIQAMQ